MRIYDTDAILTVKRLVLSLNNYQIDWRKVQSDALSAAGRMQQIAFQEQQIAELSAIIAGITLALEE